jgi:hypothetical protein
MMMIFILMIFTYSRSDSKIELIMSENNTNNLNGNLIKQNINCHSQCDDQIHYYYSMSTWTKKSFSRKAHNDIKLIHKSNAYYITRVSQWLENLALMLFTNSNPFILLWMESTSCATTWGALHSPSFGAPLACRIYKLLEGLAPSQEPYHLTSRRNLSIHMHKFIISQISTCKYT